MWVDLSNDNNTVVGMYVYCRKKLQSVEEKNPPPELTVSHVCYARLLVG